MPARLESLFSNLKQANYKITSDDGALESGYEKVAIYADENGVVVRFLKRSMQK
jgi:hypothetical protein